MTKIKFPGPTKRAHLRVSSRCPVNYVKLSKNLTPLLEMITKAYTRDICAGGIRFVMRKKIPVDSTLEFQFKIPGTAQYVAGLGKVVRVGRIGRKKLYDVGLKFLWIKRKDIELIDAYVRRKRVKEVIKKLHGK